MEIIFSEDANNFLDQLEKDKEDRLLGAIWDAIDSIADNPTSAQARRRALRTPDGHTVWMVPIPVNHNDERWVILHEPRRGKLLIPYIGPENFRQSM